MYAVVATVRFEPGRAQEAADGLPGEVIPRTKAAPGFVRATWCGNDENGLAMMLFDTAEHAEQMASSVAPPPGAPVHIESVTTYQVHAEA
jgi:hypothetical protein